MFDNYCSMLDIPGFTTFDSGECVICNKRTGYYNIILAKRFCCMDCYEKYQWNHRKDKGEIDLIYD